jgi:hypothetical protein
MAFASTRIAEQHDVGIVGKIGEGAWFSFLGLVWSDIDLSDGPRHVVPLKKSGRFFRAKTPTLDVGRPQRRRARGWSPSKNSMMPSDVGPSNTLAVCSPIPGSATLAARRKNLKRQCCRDHANSTDKPRNRGLHTASLTLRDRGGKGAHSNQKIRENVAAKLMAEKFWGP